MTTGDSRVDAYIAKATRWKAEVAKLRAILLETPLTEEFKWGVPCYTLNKTNVALIHTFKDYCAVLFVKGALLRDEARVLVQQTENVQSARQIRFTGLQGIKDVEPVLKATILEAIEVEKAGLKVQFKQTAEFAAPEEFTRKLDETPDLKTAFEALTPGRQRAYLLYFSAPKQAKTRASRIEKSIQRILDGKGLDD
jgi:uncharacterized protein YdeI (YjbR/CyaY-like superfamily)